MNEEEYERLLFRLDERYMKIRDPLRLRTLEEHNDLMRFMHQAKTDIRDAVRISGEARDSSWRTEMYIVGGTDKDGTEVVGIRARIDTTVLLLKFAVILLTLGIALVGALHH